MIQSMNIFVNSDSTNELLNICFTLQRNESILDFRQYGSGVQIKFEEQHTNHIKNTITNHLQTKIIFN